MSNLLFITTSSLASNPRLVKEFETLKDDHTCFVLFFKHHDWSFELSEEIKLRNPEVQFVEIDRRQDVFRTLLSKIIHRIAIMVNTFFVENFNVCANASDDKSIQLWFSAKELGKKYNFNRVIAHNLGAFYAAFKLSYKKAVTLQLDIEDFYPGIALYFNKRLEEQNRMKIMSQCFLKADYITYASKGIFLECAKHFKTQKKTKKLILINSFNEADFIKPEKGKSTKTTCVWFSQNISFNRGLENLFETAKRIDNIEFHIVGSKNQSFLKTVELSNNIIFHDIMEQSKLHSFLSTMDIGLALEPGKDYNNLIALSNKMLAYAQAGCYILATNTFGQSQFLNSLNYEAGEIIKISLKESLQSLKLSLLDNQSRIDRWNNAKTYSWDNEQLKLKTLLR